MTEWGTFRCSAIDCAQVPRAGLDVYWAAQTLVITRNHVPLVMRTCERLRGQATTRDCRTRQASRQPVDLDALWSRVVTPPDDEADVDGF